MPRAAKDPRGGPRQLAQGQNSGNRTDLNLHQPVEAAPDQGYGVKAQQIAAQRAVPLPQTAPVTSPSGVGAGMSGGAPENTAPATPAPGSLPFDHPSTDGLPITHGMPFGPGAGPEALLSGPPSVSAQLGSLASASNASSTIQELAAAARSIGY